MNAPHAVMHAAPRASQVMDSRQTSRGRAHVAPMRVGIILDWMNPNIEQAVRALSERGVKVALIQPEKQFISLARVQVENDLYVLKSGTDLALSLGGALHALGAATLNHYPTVAMMRSKITVTRILQAAGLPTPDTYVTTARDDLGPLLEAPALPGSWPHTATRHASAACGVSHCSPRLRRPREAQAIAPRCHERSRPAGDGAHRGPATCPHIVASLPGPGLVDPPGDAAPTRLQHGPCSEPEAHHRHRAGQPGRRAAALDIDGAGGRLRRRSPRQRGRGLPHGPGRREHAERPPPHDVQPPPAPLDEFFCARAGRQYRRAFLQ